MSGISQYVVFHLGAFVLGGLTGSRWDAMAVRARVVFMLVTSACEAVAIMGIVRQLS